MWLPYDTDFGSRHTPHQGSRPARWLLPLADLPSDGGPRGRPSDGGPTDYGCSHLGASGKFGAFRVCEGYRTAVFTILRVKTSAHNGGPISRQATPTTSRHLLGTPWSPQGH